jgi:hypothetical protein
VVVGDPDPCVGFVPGVSHACCGHGEVRHAYAVLGGEPDQGCEAIDEFVVLRGRDALTFFEVASRGLRCRGEEVQTAEYAEMFVQHSRQAAA